MLSHSSILNQITWRAQLNLEGHFPSPPVCPDWLTPLQQQDWQRRGIVVWDTKLCFVAHLYAGYAFELLEHMQVNDTWKTSGFLIGSPTHQLPIKRTTEQTNQTVEGIWTLENRLELTPDRAQDLFDLLIAQERSLEQLSTRDKKDAEDALTSVFRLIAAYGRKIQEGKRNNKLSENMQPKTIPTSIPRGRCFTVPHAA
jgi:hypothetical protein